ncbi:carbamoyltransferase N-terminal domain-containing protein [Streptomyces sp. NPDC002181]|uniref:carbamoyltransferase N-terminal domain-containing protein n=1 Tax=Streptomyces sp. NPDC002181 TaxID=3364635 RepID=UPI00368D38B2
MLICGIKMTHDGGVAVIDGNRLAFSVEMEKIGNRPRYSPLDDVARVEEILTAEGVDLASVDRFVIDGWFEDPVTGRAEVPVRDGGCTLRLPVASYADEMVAGGFRGENPLLRRHLTDHSFSRGADGYSSYHHSTGHVLGSYCASPFAARGEEALVLTWDGGATSRLYHVAPNPPKVTQVGVVLPFSGHMFSILCSALEPFQIKNASLIVDDPNDPDVQLGILSVAGKAMAYAALGTVDEAAFGTFDDLLSGITPTNDAVALVKQVLYIRERLVAERASLFPGMTSAGIIATLQSYLGQKILDEVSVQVRKHYPASRPNLALAGGCALNIKWNSKLRASGLFGEVWAPPFPNDSGAAIGAAACAMFAESGHTRLDWDVYSGPRLTTAGAAPEGWRASPCDEAQLAELLATEGEPVVFLAGRAEIGPRALGGRSLLAPATDVRTKERLNEVKGRAGYRPVAPICLTERAAEVFSPGTPDPYMLFEHRVRPEWGDRIPAVVHLDGTARLQTVDSDAGTPVSKVLTAYERLTGIPVLCNTSANMNGRGFFPDVATAAEWGRLNHIWCDGTLYTKADRVSVTD